MNRETFMLNHKIYRHYEIGLQRINLRLFSSIKINWTEIRSLLIRLMKYLRLVIFLVENFVVYRGWETAQGSPYEQKISSNDF